ncbi:17381_t:CDS:2, partial [Dentiscutata erythropus]
PNKAERTVPPTTKLHQLRRRRLTTHLEEKKVVVSETQATNLYQIQTEKPTIYRKPKKRRHNSINYIPRRRKSGSQVKPKEIKGRKPQRNLY